MICVAHIIFLLYGVVSVVQVKHLRVILFSSLPLIHHILLVLPSKYIPNLTTFLPHIPTQA